MPNCIKNPGIKHMQQLIIMCSYPIVTLLFSKFWRLLWRRKILSRGSRYDHLLPQQFKGHLLNSAHINCVESYLILSTKGVSWGMDSWLIFTVTFTFTLRPTCANCLKLTSSASIQMVFQTPTLLLPNGSSLPCPVRTNPITKITRRQCYPNGAYSQGPRELEKEAHR